MQIVIDIPNEVKEVFDKASKDDIYGCFYDYNSLIGNAIKNGVVLPEKHGRLIDADVLPCDDAISRTEFIVALMDSGIDHLQADNLIEIGQIVFGLPPVTPQPKTGHWKQISPARIYECDICGQNVMTDDISAYRYCHGCGMNMIEIKESEDKCKKCEYHRNPDYSRCHECKAESEEQE